MIRTKAPFVKSSAGLRFALMAVSAISDLPQVAVKLLQLAILFHARINRIANPCAVRRSASVGIQEKPMNQLQRQKLVNLGGVVPIPLQVAVHDGLDAAAINIRPGQGPRVKQYFPNIV